MYCTLLFPYAVMGEEEIDLYELKFSRCKSGEITEASYKAYHETVGREDISKQLGIPIENVKPISGEEYEKLLIERGEGDSLNG